MEEKITTMFVHGHTILEITKATGKQMGEVLPLIIHLAKIGKVDLIPWIEANINYKSLFKGVEYFSRVKNPTISEAKGILGLDSIVLSLCEFYANQRMDKLYIEIDRYITPEGMDVRVFCQGPNEKEGFEISLLRAQNQREGIMVKLFPNPDWTIPCATQVSGLSGNATQEVPFNYEFQNSAKELIYLD